MRSFEAISYAKWILAGEHSVLRGGSALVFPSYKHSMKFSWVETNSELEVEFSGVHGGDLRLAFWGVLEAALNQVNRKRTDLMGKLLIDNSLPLGAGLGGSAAICVGVARFWKTLGWIDEGQIFEFSRGLENLFHGESSGVDIAASIHGKGVRFSREKGIEAPVELGWQPIWYISYCGAKGVTAECVQKVKSHFSTSEDFALKIDRRMNEAVEMAQRALEMTNEQDGFPLLVDAIDNACQCFTQWKLIGPELGRHLQELSSQGAVSVKPTGSGGGGFVLSLWKTPPPEDLKEKLIPLGETN